MQCPLGRLFFLKPCSAGKKAEKLNRLVEDLRGLGEADVKEIATQSTWVPNEKTDWKAERATHSTCYLLQEALRGGVDLYRRSAADAILTQLNHVRILEPAAGQELTTKDGSRLFPSVRLIDSTSSIEVRMREEAALELSHQPDKLAFMKAVQEGDLSFPMIASVRVLIREKKKDGGAAENGEDENYLSAVVMTAEEQLVDTPYLPNKACLALNPLHALLAVPTDRMLTAVLQEVNVSPHSGLVVGADKTPCEFALSMVAATQKSRVESFGAGHRVFTANVHSVDFRGAGEYEDMAVVGCIASICTMENLTEFKLSPSKPGTPHYALVLISNKMPPPTDDSSAALPTFIADKVIALNTEAVDAYKAVLRYLCRVSDDLKFEGTPKRPVSWADTTPYTQRKVRKLSGFPTDDGLDDKA